jgi:hypothetical protein
MYDPQNLFLAKRRKICKKLIEKGPKLILGYGIGNFRQYFLNPVRITIKNFEKTNFTLGLLLSSFERFY